MEDTKVIKLGDTVEYRDSNGRSKLALVIGTVESIAPDTGLTAPAAGSAHLYVFSPTGQTYTSYDIPAGEGPHTFTVL